MVHGHYDGHLKPYFLLHFVSDPFSGSYFMYFCKWSETLSEI